MKNLRLSCLFSLFMFSAILFGQESETMTNGFLFPDFVQGTVVFNDGRSVSAPLNYSCLNQEMLFKDVSNENKIMAVAEPLTIATIIINERYFVYAGNNAYYEQVKAGDTFFYIQWISKQVSEGKATGYGGYSQTSATQSVGSFNGSGVSASSNFNSASGGGYNSLKLDEKFATISENVYFLKIKNRYKRFISASSLAKLFKGHETEITNFASEKKTDFKKPSDVAILVEFCGSLK